MSWRSHRSGIDSPSFRHDVADDTSPGSRQMSDDCGRADTADSPAPEFMAGGGRMGERIRSHDWASTPLGDPMTWPQGLRAMVRLMLTTQAPVSIYWGEGATFLYNDANEPALGSERFKTALGRPGGSVWAEVWDEVRGDIEGVRGGCGPTCCKARHLRLRDGEDLRDTWWSCSLSPIDDPLSSGGIGGVLVISTEITASVRAEQALTAERTRLLSMFENSSTFFAAVVGPDHRFQFANESYHSLVGRSDLEGRSVREALPEVEEQGLLAMLDQVYATGEPFVTRGMPVRLRRQAGMELETRWLDFVYHRVDGEGGLPTLIIAEGFDVTARVLAQQALRSANDALQAILAHSPDVVLTIDTGGRIDLSSQSSLDVVGYAPEEMRGLHCAELLGGLDEVEQLLSGVFTGRPVHSHEATAIRKDGSTTTIRWALVWAAELQKVIAIGRDASARLIEEERLKHTQKMEAIGQLTGGVAHDFNNLLTVIIGSLETIVEEGGCNAQFEPIARLALDAAERGADVTSQLLSFAGKQAHLPITVTGAEVAASFAPLARTVLRENVHLELGGLTDDWACVADKGQLQSALLNLCINARDAMGASGWLTINASTQHVGPAKLSQPGDPPPGVYACIKVSDTGSGMSPDVLARAAEPFFTTKGVGKGTGLGLSMVYGFVQQSGGFLRIRSEAGVGTTVALYLPRGVAIAPRTAAPADAMHTRCAKILVVEDDELLRHQVARQLGSLGHQVVAAQDAAAALEILSEQVDFDLLFTDMAMPGEIDGADLASRATAANPGLKVLFTTGYTDLVHGAENQFGGVLLPKPYRRAALRDAVRDALSHQPACAMPTRPAMPAA